MKEVKLSLFSYGMILVVKDLKPQQKTLRTDKTSIKVIRPKSTCTIQQQTCKERNNVGKCCSQ